MPDEKPKPIHDGYKYPMVETKPPARESTWEKIKRAVSKAAPSQTPQQSAAFKDRKDQASKLKNEQ